MNRLNFIVAWGNDKKKSWSGTNWSVYNALSKYFDVKDFDISGNRSLLGRIINKIIRLKPDFEKGKILRNRKRLTTCIPDGNVFQFSEILVDNPTVKTYIYQDLSVSHIKELKSNSPEIFKYCGFENIPPKAIENRERLQNAYYSGCAGIFTMGKWLEEYLKTTNQLIANKVHHVCVWGGGGVLT